MFFFRNGATSWSNKKQPTIALLNMKAKYRGTTIITCEIVWL